MQRASRLKRAPSSYLPPGRLTGRQITQALLDFLVTFPYYQGGNAGQPVQNPLATPQQ